MNKREIQQAALQVVEALQDRFDGVVVILYKKNSAALGDDVLGCQLRGNGEGIGIDFLIGNSVQMLGQVRADLIEAALREAQSKPKD